MKYAVVTGGTNTSTPTTNSTNNPDDKDKDKNIQEYIAKVEETNKNDIKKYNLFNFIFCIANIQVQIKFSIILRN